MNITYFRHGSIRSILDELPPADAPRFLRSDVRSDVRNMLDSIADEQEILARRAAVVLFQRSSLGPVGATRPGLSS
jgi:hypothetical protein